MEINVMSMIYDDVLPMMKKDGIEDTIKNRWAMLIGIRTAYTKKHSELGEDYIVKALNNEIDHLNTEIIILNE